jgi:hypothetical protein
MDHPVIKQQHGMGEEKIHHNPKVAVPKISCEDGAYHLSKPLISNYGVVLSLCLMKHCQHPIFPI